MQQMWPGNPEHRREMKMSTAQKVRLWAAGICQVISLILVFAIIGEPQDHSYINYTYGTTGTMLPGQVITNSGLWDLASWVVTFQIAALILGLVSLSYFLNQE
jgi:multisubunit Na+/H+ antiporter MnhB subunit